MVDALNRATSVGGVACGSDVLGNRTSTGSRSLGWDCLSRLTFVTDPSPTTGYSLVGQYAYRADGMRTLKYTPNALSVYRHDGQMGMEDEEWSTDHFVTRYGLGARGVDMIERTSSSGTVTAFPLYDAHGNNVASLTRDGSGGYSLGDRRSYDAWGVVRSQQSGGDPKLRYCANLGHRQDDETGLVYMRARYYEPGSGRFISQDPSGHGWNWFVHCSNDPVNRVDSDGRADEAYGQILAIGLILTAAAIGLAILNPVLAIHAAQLAMIAMLGCLSGLGEVYGNNRATLLAAAGATQYYLMTAAVLTEAKVGSETAAAAAVIGLTAYTFAIMAVLIDMDVQFEGGDGPSS